MPSQCAAAGWHVEAAKVSALTTRRSACAMTPGASVTRRRGNAEPSVAAMPGLVQAMPGLVQAIPPFKGPAGDRITRSSHMIAVSCRRDSSAPARAAWPGPGSRAKLSALMVYAYHDDRTAGTMNAVLADRAEQRLSEPAVPSAAHHEQAGTVTGFQQRHGSAALHDLRPHPDVAGRVDEVADRLGHCLLGYRREVAVLLHLDRHHAVSRPRAAGYAQTITASTLAPVSSACRTAQRSAASPDEEPSTPTPMRGPSPPALTCLSPCYTSPCYVNTLLRQLPSGSRGT
jgi:hypothetical protein